MKPCSSTISSAFAVTPAEAWVAAYDRHASAVELDNYGCAAVAGSATAERGGFL
jgi:hypothetical protein